MCISPEELDIPDKRQGGDSGSLIGGRWFDFDDSDVKPISESDLEKQFMGKESAYMLFYRKKMLQRPQTGKSSHLQNLFKNWIFSFCIEVTVRPQVSGHER